MTRHVETDADGSTRRRFALAETGPTFMASVRVGPPAGRTAKDLDDGDMAD